MSSGGGGEAGKGNPGRRMRPGQAAFALLYADGILAVLNLLAVPYLVGKLGPEPYGILGLVTVLAGQLGLLHFGVGTAATRLVADSVGRGGEQLALRTTGVAVVAAGASLLVGGVFWAAAPSVWRSGFSLSPGTLPMALASVPAAAALVALTPATAATYGVLAAREQFLFSAGLRLWHGAGRLGAAVAVVALEGGIAGIFWAQAVVDLSAVLVGAARGARGVERTLPTEWTHRARALRDSARAVLVVGLPFALVSLLSGLLTDAEKLAIGLARSVEDFTYYAVPFNAAIKFTAISGAVVRVLVPRIAILVAREDTGGAATMLERADRILVAGMLAVLAPVVAFVPELLGLWVGAEFAERSSLATRIILVGILANAAALPAHAALLARGRLSSLNLLYAAEVVLHLVVVYALVTAFGLVGAAAAWTVRVGIDLAAQRALAGRTLGVGLRSGLPIGVAVAALLALALVASAEPSAPVRGALALLAMGGASAYVARGPDRALLLDSVLPWRWRGARAE